MVNIDDPYSDEFLKSTVDTLITFGNSPNAQIRALDVQEHLDGTDFKVKMPSGTFNIQTSLLGKFNVSNILAAIGVLVSQKVEVTDIQEAIASV